METLRYVVTTDELNRVMEHLYRILDIRITFFDMQGCEKEYFDMKEMSAYCARRRRDPEFHTRCVACDGEHLDMAKERRDVLIYHCHSGLLEGIVPLYNARNVYLGSIVFGQLRDARRRAPAGMSAAHRKLYRKLPRYTVEQVSDIGNLLKYVSEYIVRNELIRYRNKPWAEAVEAYIEKHLSEKITLEKLAGHVGRSASFISHHFPAEFGQSPRRYVLARRMEEARIILENGHSVQDTARRLGFYDAFHFSKAFRAFWGSPPRSYKP
jgi:AraC-like DNA-binding protein/ligand-binding sensor protein